MSIKASTAKAVAVGTVATAGALGIMMALASEASAAEPEPVPPDPDAERRRREAARRRAEAAARKKAEQDAAKQRAAEAEAQRRAALEEQKRLATEAEQKRLAAAAAAKAAQDAAREAQRRKTAEAKAEAETKRKAAAEAIRTAKQAAQKAKAEQKKKLRSLDDDQKAPTKRRPTKRLEPRKTREPTTKPAPTPAPRKTPRSKYHPVTATERRNAALVLVAMPGEHKGRNMKPREGQKLADWLANVVYWDTYPNAPTKLSAKKRSHKPYVQAWIRIRGYIDRGLRLLPQLGTNPVRPDAQSPVAERNWQRWALSVSFSSPLRTASKLRTAFRKAWQWIFDDPKGIAWRKKWVGQTVVNERVDVDGLLAEAGVWLGGPRSHAGAVSALERWPMTVTKAYLSTNGIMERVPAS